MFLTFSIRFQFFFPNFSSRMEVSFPKSKLYFQLSSTIQIASLVGNVIVAWIWAFIQNRIQNIQNRSFVFAVAASIPEAKVCLCKWRIYITKKVLDLLGFCVKSFNLKEIIALSRPRRDAAKTADTNGRMISKLNSL